MTKMSEVVRVDKRITKTKNNLKTALVKLLENHKIEDISIVEWLMQYSKVKEETFVRGFEPRKETLVKADKICD